jgi:mRNA interferase RelE/StbE
MAFTIEFTASAEREFKALERSTQRRIATAIDVLAENPFHPGVKKLQGEPGLCRTRAGDYRVIFRVDPKRVRVLILKFGHRREVYR